MNLINHSIHSSYYAIGTEGNLYLFSNENLLLGLIKNVESYTFSTTNDNVIYYIDQNKKLFEMDLKLNIKKYVRKLLRGIHYPIHDCEKLFILSFYHVEDSIECIDELPYYKNNIKVTLDYNGHYLINETINEISDISFEYLNQDTHIINIKASRHLKGITTNQLILINLKEKKLEVRDIQFNAKGLISTGNLSYFYAKDPTKFGSYANQSIWLLFHSTNRVVNLGSNDKYYGNCTLSDVLSDETSNICVDTCKIYYIVSEKGNTYIEELDVEKKVTRIIYQDLSTIHQISLNDGKLYILESNIRQKYVLKIFDLKCRAVVFLYNILNEDMNVVQTQGNFEGIDYFILQDEFKNNKKTILWIPGGPMFQYGYGYIYLLNTLALNGYSIVTINSIGRQGYGQEFCNAIRGSWGDKDIDCIEKVITHLVTEQIICTPITIIGHSYGAYISYLLLSHKLKGMFNKGIAIAGISSKFSLFSNSDIGYLEYLECNKFPWEDIDYYLTRSPLYSLLSIDCPLLLIHGTKDTRVSIQESQQVFSWLKSIGKNVKMLRIRDGNHKWIYSGNISQKKEMVNYLLKWIGE
ncbi:TPA: S9 family peptidase [Bacillus pseudomycoides]|nr:S9 family peptidase [Bacillus pseudomycoides]